MNLFDTIEISPGSVTTCFGAEVDGEEGKLADCPSAQAAVRNTCGCSSAGAIAGTGFLVGMTLLAVATGFYM